jgi:hypothetical protein
MKQELVIGALVVHKVYGIGAIISDDGVDVLVYFDNSHRDLHNAESTGVIYPSNHMYWFSHNQIKSMVTTQAQPKTESQQLVDILVQLGFKNKYNGDYPYNYYSKKLNVWWNDFEDVVCNYCLKKNNDYISKIYDESVATNIAYFQKKLDKKLKNAAAKQASQSQVEAAIVEEQKVSELINVEQVTKTKPANLMKLPQINWTNRIANYDMVMEELRQNEFRPSKDVCLTGCYYWKHNPDLLAQVNIYSWALLTGLSGCSSKLTEFGSVDKFRSELAKALKATPKRFKLKKDAQ